jgi:hypothetical protein
MKGAPSFARMMNPDDEQGDRPDYVDKSAEAADNTFYPSRGDDAPAYVGSNPRYWEYR